MKKDSANFLIKPCVEEDLKRILDIQEQTFKQLGESDILRRNTPEMLQECLKSPNVTLGAWYNDDLAAFSVLYFPDDEENLAKLLDNVDVTNLKYANYKLCIVKSEYRGNSLQYSLGTELIKAAKELNVQILCCTASPHNPYSIRNIEKLGFKYNKTLQKYGFERNLYYCIL